MKAIAFASSLLLFSIGTTLRAQGASPISLVQAGIDNYLRDGAAAAIKVWIKGSAVEGNAETLSQANVLRQIEDLYGKLDGFDVISETVLSSRTHIVYFVMNYGKGPVYCIFECYKTGSGKWILTQVNFNTKALLLLPQALLVPPKQ